MATLYQPSGTAGTYVNDQTGLTTGGYDSTGNLFKFGTTADNLINPPKLTTVPTQQPSTPPDQFVNNLQPVIKQSQDGLVQAQTQEAEQRNNVLNQLLGVKDPNSQKIYDTKFNSLQGNDFVKQFTDANTRLAQLQGVFNTGMQKISSAKGQSQVFEGLQLNEANRQKAVEVGNQALVVQAMQGNIETARQIALDTSKFASEDRANKLQSLMAQFQSLDGIVQGQEKQLIEKAKAKADQELKQLERTQSYVDSAISSGDASVQEMQQLTDPKLTDQEKMAVAAQIINRSAAAKTAFERNNGKFTLSMDGEGNPLIFNSRTGELKGSVNLGALNQQAPDGSTGGQCGVFAHTICDFPTVGNTVSEKKASVDKNGVPAAQWRQSDANPGDVLIFDIGQYGHVSVVTQDNGDGTVTVKDSNFGLDGKVQTRIVDKNDPKLYGVLKGNLKSGLVNDSLEASKGTDGFVNPDVYLQKRQKAKISADEFDKKYGYLLSPQEQTRLGITNAPKAASAESIKLAENAQSGLRALGTLENEISSDPSVVSRAVVPLLAPKYKAARDEIVDVMARLRTGAALTQSEEEFYKSQLPTYKDNAESASYKLQKIREFLQGVINRSQGTQAASSGGSADPLGIR